MSKGFSAETLAAEKFISSSSSFFGLAMLEKRGGRRGDKNKTYYYTKYHSKNLHEYK